MSVTDNRDDILVAETVEWTPGPNYGTWASTQGAASVAISGTVTGTGTPYLSEANDTETPTELFAHGTALDGSSQRFYAIVTPASGFVALGFDATSDVTVSYSIRVVERL